MLLTHLKQGNETENYSETLYLNETVDSNDFYIFVRLDNVLVFISHNITAEKVAKVELFLSYELDPLTFSVACLLTTQPNPRRSIPNCSRNVLIQGCRQYNATIQLVFNDESTLEIPQLFTTYPGTENCFFIIKSN